MKTIRRSFLSVLTAVPFLALTGCAGQTPAMVISEVEAAINDAEIAIATIITGVNAYFAVHPNPTLQAQIDNAVTDVTSALGIANTALAGATSITAGNVQAALTAFANAYAALMALIAQIGIQTAAAGAPSARINGVLYVKAPLLLKLVKAPVAPAAPVGK